MEKALVRGQDVEDLFIDEHQVGIGRRYYCFRVKQKVRGKEQVREAEQTTSSRSRVRVIVHEPSHIVVEEESGGAVCMLRRDGVDVLGNPLWSYADGTPVALFTIFPPRAPLAAML